MGWKENSSKVIAAGALFYLATHAFSFEQAHKIFKRDKGTCRISGKRYGDGWRLDAAHIDHRRNGRYNETSNGRMLGVLEHAEQHLLSGDRQSGALIISRALRKGLHHDWHYRNNPEDWLRDREEVIFLAEKYNINTNTND